MSMGGSKLCLGSIQANQKHKFTSTEIHRDIYTIHVVNVLHIYLYLFQPDNKLNPLGIRNQKDEDFHDRFHHYGGPHLYGIEMNVDK